MVSCFVLDPDPYTFYWSQIFKFKFINLFTLNLFLFILLSIILSYEHAIHIENKI